MSEPKEQKRGLLAMVTRKDLIHLAISVIVSILLGAAFDLTLDSQKRVELSAIRAKAYITIAQFAPWNVAQRYIAIVTTQGDAYAEALAQQQERQSLLFRGFACNLRGNYASGEYNSVVEDNPCIPPDHPHGLRALYLSAHVPAPLRLVSAFLDLLFHAFVDQGMIGFLVAAAQVALGALLTRLAIRYTRIKVDSFFSYVLGLPLGVLFLGSIAAIPLWLLALAGLMGLKALPMAGFGAQAGGTGWLASFVARKTAEVVGHAAVMKQVERVIRD
jgi:hypothetical protein